jgi:hypothetical protein
MRRHAMNERTFLMTRTTFMHTRIAALVLGLLALGACSDPTDPSLNNPSQSEFTTVTDPAQVQNFVIGVLTGDRGVLDNEIMYGEIIGRDLYNTTGAEPRFTTSLLGPRVPGIDPSGFLGTGVWPYDVIHLADIAVHAIDSAAPVVLSDEAKAGAKGVIRTVKAMEYTRAIETRDTTGIPINTDLPNLEVAPISCKADVLAYIAALLDSAAVDLAGGGASFTFTMPRGFTGFDTPATFLTFNRALAAKIDIYRGFQNYAASKAIDAAALTSALAEIDSSYLVLDASQLDLGPQHTYSTIAGDATNPLFEDPSTAVLRVNPRVVDEAEAGDRRVANAVTTGSPVSRNGVSSNLLYQVYPSNTSAIPLLPNKELILMKAEIEWGLGQYGDALDLSNFIRQNDGGLAPASAALATQPDSLLTEILRQKRYSLLFESAARWIDARMFGRLTGNPPAGLGQERDNDPIAVFPLPQSELDARPGGITKECTTGS